MTAEAAVGSPGRLQRPEDATTYLFATVDEVTAALSSGSAIVLLDDIGADHEGALVFAASAADTELVAFVVRYSSGFVEAALPPVRATALRLPRQARASIDRDHKPQLISVDALGIGTGISAGDRAITIRALADPTSAPSNFRRPGHVPTYLVHEDGVIGKIATEEAAYDLVRLSGVGDVAAYAGLVSDRDPTRMARTAELLDFATEHGLPIVLASAVVAYRLDPGDPFRGGTVISTREVELHSRIFRVTEWRHGSEQTLTLALGDQSEAPVCVYDECFCSLFDPEGCACRRQLADAVHAIATAGSGLLIYRRITESGAKRCDTSIGDDLPVMHGMRNSRHTDRAPSPFGP